MKLLLVDIETSPNTAFVWGLWKQDVNPSHLINTSSVLCFSAKWLGEKNIIFDSVQESSSKSMLKRIHALLDEADAVIHYNGKRFDIPVLNREFIKNNLTPPSPAKQIDLMLVVRDKFKFESNRLDFVCKALGLGEKLRHAGFEMWTGCMDGNPTAWKNMKRYNRQDVVLLEHLYRRLQPWVEQHPNHSALHDVACCPKCGSKNYQRRGEALTQTMRYARYQCKECGGWFRGTKTVSLRGGDKMTNVAA